MIRKLWCRLFGHRTERTGVAGGTFWGRQWIEESFYCPRCYASWIDSDRPPDSSW